MKNHETLKFTEKCRRTSSRINSIFNFILFPERKTSKFLDKLSAQDINCLINLKCIGDDPPTWSILSYKDRDIEKLIHIAKYQNSERASELLGKIVNSTLHAEFTKKDSNLIDENSPVILIPIPSSKDSQAERGFSHLSRILNSAIHQDFVNNRYDASEKYMQRIIIYNALEKVLNTKRQATLSKSERLMNLKSAFRMRDEYIEILKNEKNIFLFDDVTTTGTTLKECRKVIIESFEMNHLTPPKIKALIIAF